MSAICEFDFSPLVTQDSNGFLSDAALSKYDTIIATFQATTIKWELVRVSDCFGLVLLSAVSYCQYRERAWEETKDRDQEKVKFIDKHNDKDKDKDKYNDKDEDKDWKKQDMIKNIV